MKTLGEVLPLLLKSYGFDTVFGIPGVHTVELYRGLPESGLTHITPRHEQGAGFMADGYARASGKPAVCFIISGPGMTNITTAMGQAYADSVPMLVISSVINRSELARGEGRLHELKNQRALVEGVAEFSHTVLSVNELPAVMAKAMSVLTCARPRPVHIELPLDIIVQGASAILSECEKAKPILSRPAANPEAILAAQALLNKAKNPMLIVGGGAVNAANEVRQLVDKLQCPVILTINAKGILPSNHPYSLGSLMPEPAILKAIKQADVILAIGSELGETDHLQFGDYLKLSGKLIRLDIDYQQLHKNNTADVAIWADAKQACQALSQNLKPSHSKSKALKLVQTLRKQVIDGIPENYKQHGRLLRYIDRQLTEVIFAGDSTQPVYGGNLTYNNDQPRRWFNSSTGYGTLGYGLPSGLGAKIACPQNQVVVIIGDGGLQFTIAELATAVELKLAVLILLWNNKGYGEIKKYMLERDIPTIGVDIYTPDFGKIAEGFGCDYHCPKSLSQFTQCLSTFKTKAVPTIIEINENDALEWEIK